jgi:hypothetical protein
VAFPGMPADRLPLRVTVDSLVDSPGPPDTSDPEGGGSSRTRRTGRVGPVELEPGSAPYASVAWQTCDAEDPCEPCHSTGDLASPDATDLLLAVRFVDAE